MERVEPGERYTLGSAMPEFSLPGTDGNTYTQEYFSNASVSVVVFTCNHCPYVKGSDQELLSLLHDYQEKGVKAVLISSNDTVQYPDDSFEHMKQKAKELEFPAPYCFDESQEVARAFDAQCTPECFVFDDTGTYVFHGSINDSPRDPAGVRTHVLKEALDSLLQGKKPEPAWTPARGCSIKWKA